MDNLFRLSGALMSKIIPKHNTRLEIKIGALTKVEMACYTRQMATA